MICKNHRRGEEECLPRAQKNFSNPNLVLGSYDEDLDGVDIVDSINRYFISIYARCRFGGYLDITFNGDQALKKVVSNIFKYEKYIVILQYAEGTSFSDPDFRVIEEHAFDLKKWFLTVIGKSRGVYDHFLENPQAYGFTPCLDDYKKRLYILPVGYLKDFELYSYKVPDNPSINDIY